MRAESLGTRLGKLGNAYSFNITMLGVILFILGIVGFILLIKINKVDFTLKFYQLFGKKNEDLCGKVVWITGASSGIGECLAYELASVGCKLILSARRQAELDRVKAKCCDLAEGKVKDFNKDSNILVLPLDVTKFDTHKDAMKCVLDHFGQVDILVNNSGRSQRSSVVDTKLEVDQSLFELNVLGTISMTKTVLPYMIERKDGHIVVVGSVSGKIGTPTSATYSATKFALQGYFDSLRFEVFNSGIKITTVCPGPVKSAIVDNAFREDVTKTFKDEATKEQQSRRMDTELFVKIMVTAIANELDEVWISTFPVILFTYCSVYLPTITRWFGKRIALKAMQKIRSSEGKKQQ